MRLEEEISARLLEINFSIKKERRLIIATKIKGLFPRILTLYFLVQYIFGIISFQSNINLEPINIIIFSILLVYVMYKIDKEKIQIRSLLMVLVLYMIIFTTILSISAIFPKLSTYSLIRVLITSWLYFSMIIIFYYVLKKTYENESWHMEVSKNLLLILIIAILGQIFIPSWIYGNGLRFSGGMNPNGMGYIALFCNFWFMYHIIVKEYMNKIIKWGWALSLIIIILSMSRTIIFSLFVLYTFYFFMSALVGIYKLTYKQLLSFILIILILILVINYVEGTLWFQQNLARLADPTNLLSRQSAWNVSLEYFENNVLIGDTSWWNLTNVLNNSMAQANSPHSSYLRILAESGILGLIITLLLPIILFILLIFRSYFERTSNGKQMVLIASMLLSLLVVFAFEDRYLVGYGNFNTGIFAWVVSMGLFTLFGSSPVKKNIKNYN